MRVELKDIAQYLFHWAIIEDLSHGSLFKPTKSPQFNNIPVTFTPQLIFIVFNDMIIPYDQCYKWE